MRDWNNLGKYDFFRKKGIIQIVELDQLFSKIWVLDPKTAFGRCGLEPRLKFLETARRALQDVLYSFFNHIYPSYSNLPIKWSEVFDMFDVFSNNCFKTDKNSKKDLLFKTLQENKKSKNDKILIFVQQKRVADFLASNVSEMLANMEVVIK